MNFKNKWLSLQKFSYIIIIAMNKTIFKKIQDHCTEELWMLVLKDSITIDESDEKDWDVSEILNSDIPQNEVMKVICCFEKVGGLIFYKGNYTPYVFLCKELNCDECDKFRLYWLNNKINGMKPVFGLGNIEVPKILPKYISEPIEDGNYVICKLFKGKYIRIKGEIYLSKDIANQRAEELNLTSNLFFY